MFLEVIAKSLDDVKKINTTNADRIELCKDLELDGLTPDYELIKECTEYSKIPINVIVRPSDNNFFYTELEKEQILKDIEFIKSTKANGIVIGVLNKDFTIDEDYLKKVKEAAGNLEITFHKAFDLVNNFEKEFDVLQKHKITNVLTSGGKNISKGFDKLKILANKSNETNILIGGGVKLKNLSQCLNISNNIHIGTAARTQPNWNSEIDTKKINKFKNYY